MSDKFNESFNNKGEKPRFTYKRNPLVENAYQLFEFKQEKGDYEPIGDYTLIDTKEMPVMTEKKMMNLVSILNGKHDLMDLSNLTDTRLLYNIVPRTSEDAPTKIIFRTYDGQGVSTENAVLTIEKGVLKDD